MPKRYDELLKLQVKVAWPIWIGLALGTLLLLIQLTLRDKGPRPPLFRQIQSGRERSTRTHGATFWARFLRVCLCRARHGLRAVEQVREGDLAEAKSRSAAAPKNGKRKALVFERKCLREPARPRDI